MTEYEEERQVMFGRGQRYNPLSEELAQVYDELAVAQAEIEHLKELVLKTKAEHLAVYRKLASAELSARLGWQRYLAANKAHLSLQHKYAQKWEEKQ